MTTNWKLGVAVLGACLATSAVVAQQSTTNTNCNVNGQQVDCTSTTTTNTPPPDPWAGFNRQLQQDSERLSKSFAASAQRRAEMDQATIRVVYCKQNPDSSVTVGNGETRACPDEIAYAKAACTVKRKLKFCKALADGPSKK